MALTFDLKAIPEDVRLVTVEQDDPVRALKAGDQVMNPVTETLIFSTMALGIGEITDATLDEFVARIDLFQKLHGALMSTWDGKDVSPRPITREDVEAHKGLKTNVFPMETRTAWVKRTVTQDRALYPAPEPRGRR